MTNLTCWWHRKILRHEQEIVMNGATEPGVRCYCHGWRSRYYRWFASDGGGGK